jgi:hypothetical protein
VRSDVKKKKKTRKKKREEEEEAEDDAETWRFQVSALHASGYR